MAGEERYIPAHSPTTLDDPRISRATPRRGQEMPNTPLLRMVLQDEAVTRGLGDEEARILVEWLVDWAELLTEEAESESAARNGMHMLCRKARGIGRFVQLWVYQDARGPAAQLAAAERFSWPLPVMHEDPVELMLRILAWEDRQIVV
jgi:hypothetical protein